MKKLIATIALLACLTASGAEFGSVNGKVGTFTALTNAGSPVLKASDTNGWDVSAGGGGGGLPNSTNYYCRGIYSSNGWYDLASGVSNILQFNVQTVDKGNMFDPATGYITIRKSGDYHVDGHWYMVHAIGPTKSGMIMLETNGFNWMGGAHTAGSTENVIAKPYDISGAAYLPSGTVVRCRFYHNEGSGRLGGGDSDHASPIYRAASHFGARLLGGY